MSDKKLENFQKFANLTYEDFRKLANDKTLSRYEKIGFPDDYRSGFETNIFQDICAKLPALGQENKNILDIGPGCSDLPNIIIRHCSARNHKLTLVDSKEMLAHLPDDRNIFKIDGPFPKCYSDIIKSDAPEYDAIIAYSIFHYVIVHQDVFSFIDRALSLLKPGGRFLLGDIPNISKRKRFFCSEAGKKFHRSFMQTNEDPLVNFNCQDFDAIDDSVLMALYLRARNSGFDAYIVPQPDHLPLANRREDMIFIRP